MTKKGEPSPEVWSPHCIIAAQHVSIPAASTPCLASITECSSNHARVKAALCALIMVSACPCLTLRCATAWLWRRSGGSLILPGALTAARSCAGSGGEYNKIEGRSDDSPYTGTGSSDARTGGHCSLKLKSCGVLNGKLQSCCPGTHCWRLTAQLCICAAGACWLAVLFCVSAVALTWDACSSGVREASGLLERSMRSGQGYDRIFFDLFSRPCRLLWGPA